MSISTVDKTVPNSEMQAATTKAEAVHSSDTTRGLKLAHLWVIVPFTIAWFMQSISSIEPYDFWWNVKSGEIMTRTGSFLATDVLVWTPVRAPYSNPQWGSQLIFYWLYNLSPYLLLTARVLIVALTLGIIMWVCRLRTGTIRAAAIATLVAYLTGLTNYGMRPQLLAFLPFVIFLFLLEEKNTRPQWLPLLVPVMLFWVNVHGSFFLGVALLAIYALGTLLERAGSPEGRVWLRSGAAVWQAVWLSAAALVTLANPYFDFVYRYFFIATNDPIARSLNVEWQAPTIYDGTGILFYSNVLIFLVSLYISKRRLRPTEILLVLAFAYLALTSLRNVLWWGWITAPMLAANFSVIGRTRQARREERAAQRAASRPEQLPVPPPAQRTELPALNWLIALLLVSSALVFTPLWRPANPLVPPTESAAVAGSTPVKLAAYIREKHPPSPLFNYMEWGGYLEWELYPTYQLFIDGRFEARTVDVWHDYLSVSRARNDWQSTLDRYGARTLILNRDWHADLVKAVSASPTWHKAYEDEQGIIFTR